MNKNNYYDKRMSDAINWLRFPLIFFVILLHCYSVSKLAGEHHTFFRALYPFSLWLGETGVPCFFFISGYLFFLSKKNYQQKIATRIQTLFVPYILWNGLLLLSYLILYTLGFPMDINGKNIADYGIIDYIRAFWDRGQYDQGNFVPLLCPLWYIRNLMIICIISPLIYCLTKYIREIYLVILVIWWFFSFHNAFIPQTILFFSLGAYFSIHMVNPLKLYTKHIITIIIIFILSATADIASHTVISCTISLQLHRLSIICNIPILFLFADHCTRHGLSNKSLSDSAFIVFCCHYPITVLLRKTISSNYSHLSDEIHILLYFICVIISTILSLSIYYTIVKWFPRVKKLLSGNR